MGTPGSEVICAREEIDDKTNTIRRAIGEVGRVSWPTYKKIKGKKTLKVCVEWTGKDRYGKEKTKGSRGFFDNCLVIAHTKKRRRMAQREFSNRRDSPVMVRLLEQIIDAQDD